tara:strand:- start:171 stop:1547 length:1377 start_codon:yes stop_codon:yes gene_type:complete
MVQIFFLSFLYINLHAQDLNVSQEKFNPLWKKSESSKSTLSTKNKIYQEQNDSNGEEEIDFGSFGERTNNHLANTDPLDEFLKFSSRDDSEVNSPFIFGQNHKNQKPKTESRKKLRNLLDDFLISQRKLNYETLVSLPKPSRLDEIKRFIEVRLGYYRYNPKIEILDQFEWKVDLPAWVNLPFLARKLQRQSFKEYHFNYTYTSLKSSQKVTATLLVNSETELQLLFEKPQPSARVSIVIDDMGHMSRGFKIYRKMGHPMTMAFLPFYDTSKMQSELAHSEGFEIMLHMPMQPNHRLYFRSPLVIETGLDEDEIRSRVRKSLHTVPLAQGFNNHQGSKATRDLDLMRLVMDEVSQHQKLYFIDSVTTGSSKAYQAATEAGFAASKRNSDFLDNVKTHEAITKKLEELIDLSLRSKGVRLAIIHETKVSAKAVQQVLPKLESLNIEVVSPSDFIKPNVL